MKIDVPNLSITYKTKLNKVFFSFSTYRMILNFVTYPLHCFLKFDWPHRYSKITGSAEHPRKRDINFRGDLKNTLEIKKCYFLIFFAFLFLIEKINCRIAINIWHPCVVPILNFPIEKQLFYFSGLNLEPVLKNKKLFFFWCWCSGQDKTCGTESP